MKRTVCFYLINFVVFFVLGIGFYLLNNAGIYTIFSNYEAENLFVLAGPLLLLLPIIIFIGALIVEYIVLAKKYEQRGLRFLFTVVVDAIGASLPYFIMVNFF